MTTDGSPPRARRARRRHAAAGARIAAGSLSAAAALALMGVMAHTTGGVSSAPDPRAAPRPEGSTVIVTRRSADTGVGAPVAPTVAPARTAPVATSRAS